MRNYVLMIFSLGYFSCIGSALAEERKVINSYSENSSYWQYKGQTGLLHGGTVTNNIFQIENLESHPGSLADMRVNCIRNTISVSYKMQPQDFNEEIQHNFINRGIAGKKAVISCRLSTEWGTTITMVSISVPAIPGLEFDVWCYEDELGKGECFPQTDGSMILKHSHSEDAVVETKIVPHENMVDWYVTITGSTKEAVQNIEFVNPCWQFRHSQGFNSLNGQYVESFVNRCFIYTDRGFTFLKETKRYPDTRKPEDDYRNTPETMISAIAEIESMAEEQNREMDAEIEKQNQQPIDENIFQEMGDKVKRYRIVDVNKDIASKIKLPQFFLQVQHLYRIQKN